MAPTQPKSLHDDAATLVQDLAEIERSRQLSRRRELPPADVPGYHIGTCLGEGAYGSVWQAVDANTGRQVAIKFYTHRSGLDWSLLNREVEKLAVLYTCRNIVGLLEVGWDSVPPYYVMELLENGSLAALLAKGALAPAEAVRIARGVLHALVHAHGRGILHCDLKPANVLLGADLEPRLCDFGQSRLSNEQNPALGTLFYMAPEQADLEAIPDARWDVYALGALLYHALCGRAPHYSAENERLIRSADTLEERLAIYRRILLQSPRANGHRKMPGVDKRLCDIVDRCLHVNPQKRIPNAQAVLDLLELRDRQRARRPLMAIGIVGPSLLLLAMVPIALKAMDGAVASARSHLSERALESAALPVEILTKNVARELENRKQELREAADDEALRTAIEAAAANNWSDRGPLTVLLQQHKAKVDEHRRQEERNLDTSWFLTDAKGFQRWREPYNPETIDKNWAHRDYFGGRGREFPTDAVPQDIKPIRDTYVCLAFRSKATKQYMIAISTPVWDLTHEHVIGVLAMTTHLGQLLPEYQSSIRGGRDERINRIIALVDSRNSRLLDHPWMTKETLKSLPDEAFEQLTRFSGITADQVSHGCGRDDSYHDPVARLAPELYGGEWLAAYCPVGNTGWTAIVQERKDAALKPVEEMREGLLEYGMWGLVVSCGLIGAFSYVVLLAMNSRRLLGRSKGGVHGDLPNGTTLTES